MKRKNNKIALLAALIVVMAFFGVALVFVSVRVTYHQWVSDEAIEQLEWVTNNLTSSDRPVIFVIDRNISPASDFVEMWRRVIGSFIPNSLIYTGRIDDLLLFREPRFNDAKLQGYAEQCWDELRAQVRYPENLTSIEVVVLSYFYQPITRLELDTRLVQLSEGVYLVNNYTAVNRLILLGNFDYSSVKGPWYGLGRNWSSSRTVLEIDANVSTDFFVTYPFYLYERGNYTISVAALDDLLGYVPVSVMLDDEQIMLINYSGTGMPRTYNSTRIYLAEGHHIIRVSPALNGSLLFDLDYIEIDKISS